MLCDVFPDIDRCTVMQHLKVLEEADLIVARRDGRERWNHLNALPIKQIHDRWISQYADPCAEHYRPAEIRSGGIGRCRASPQHGALDELSRFIYKPAIPTENAVLPRVAPGTL